jgi:hypothetical protein
MNPINTYQGQNLEDLPKERLIEIIIEMAQMQELQSKEHMQTLERLLT